MLFDVDDTLVKTWVAKYQQHKFVAKKYYGVELTDEELNKHWGKPMHKLIEGLYGHLAPSLEVGTENYHRHAKDFPKMLQDDTLATIKQLHETGLKLGLVTSWWRSRLKDDFKTYKLPEEYFDVVQGAEDSDYHKPDPRVFEPALSQLAKLGITDGIAYVGDALMDFEAAKAAGLHFVGITTGMVDAEAFKQAGAKQIIARLAELPDTLVSA